MAKADMELMFADIRDNNDKGAREYRVAEGVGPIPGTAAPVDDTDLALFEGQLFVYGTALYFASNVSETTTTWTQVTTA